MTEMNNWIIEKEKEGSWYKNIIDYIIRWENRWCEWVAYMKLREDSHQYKGRNVIIWFVAA
ncbi:hypothetical protein CE91St56_42680 [Lachnospiraceae bacterium]|nr:hypothetical protein CE91St56_42680 [Lachnospiraceae bacterium]GKH43220.1 hypothetical protein CE91St57_41940 [Lachnospiraceae bacterium]